MSRSGSVQSPKRTRRTIGSMASNPPADPRSHRLLRTYAVLTGINKLIVRERDPATLLQNACAIAVCTGGFVLAWIGLVDEEAGEVRHAASAGVADGELHPADSDLIDLACGDEPTARVLKSGQHDVVNDLAAGDPVAPWQAAALARGYRSAAAFPIVLQGRIVGTFNLFSAEQDFFDGDECQLFTELATDMGFALGLSWHEMQRRAGEDRITRQRATLIDLASASPADDHGRALRRIAEASARTLKVDRVSIWRYVDGGSALSCVELYERQTGRHSNGATLASRSYPAYFHALLTSDVIAADHADEDPRTLEFVDDYLRPLGISSMLDVPIRIAGLRAGVLCHEHVGSPRRWTADEKTFAVAIASLVSLTLETGQRLAAQRAAAERSERFEEIAETIQDVFWVADPETDQTLYVNPSYERIWGRPATTVLQDPNAWLDGVHPDDRERVSRAARGKRETDGYDEVYRIVRPDGSVRWVRDQAFLVRGGAGGIRRIVGVARDITDNRQLEEQLRQSQKMEAIGQLAGGVAHDFNNILAAIIMQAELTATGELPTEARDGLGQIRAAAERAANLTRQLLLFSRRQVMHPRELDINESVTHLARMLQRIIGEDIKLQLHLHGAPLFTRADAGMLDQVLLNLAVNARDAMPAGGRLLIETLQVQLHQDRTSLDADAVPGTYVCLRISDSGSGIEPDILPRIFEPFFTTKEPGKGTGLGLATVFGIVKQHRGWIEVESRPGEGSVFAIYLPTAQGGAASVVPEAVPASHRGNETILLAEDDPSVRALIQATLVRHGYTVLEAASGADALLIWADKRDRIDMLLTDLVMPGGVSGQQLAERLHTERPSLPVVYTSGYSAEIAGRELSLNPGENFVQKPFPPFQLLDIVRRSLQQR
jgi:PAS domain S-box-containing protein